MSNFTNIKREITNNIYDNNTNAITASVVRTTLIDMIDAVDENLPVLEQVRANWNETDSLSYSYIQNKPSIPTKTSDLVNDSNFVVDSNYVHTDNNYTTVDKNKLNSISTGAEVNVQSDWSETNTSSDSYILNKPSIPNTTSDLVNDSNFVVSTYISNIVSLTESEYDAMSSHDSRTFYLIKSD